MMKHLPKKPSRAPSYKKNNDDILERLHIQRSNLNISAGGKIYEKAKSRGFRHRLALMSSDQSSDAVPLGKGGKRGPGRTASIAGEIAKNQRVRWIGFGAREREGEADKVRELIESGQAVTGSKPKISLKSRKFSSSSPGNSTVSRPRIIKRSKQSKTYTLVVAGERTKQMKKQKL